MNELQKAIAAIFNTLPTADKVELLEKLAQDTPNPMNEQDNHIITSTTYLANMLSQYHSDVVSGKIKIDQTGKDTFEFIGWHF